MPVLRRLIVLIWAVVLSACSGGLQPAQPTASPSSTPSLAPTASYTPTQVPSPRATPTSSPTSTPSPTPVPTATAYGGFARERLVAWVKAGKIIISQVDGSHPLDVSSGYTSGSYPSILGWTADGQWLLFTEACYGLCNTHGWAARPDGSEVRLLFSNQVDSHQISFLPDGVHFVVECPSEKEYSRNLCSGSINGTSIDSIGIEGDGPQYSPDGTRLAWVEKIGTSVSKKSLQVKTAAQPQEVVKYLSNLEPPEFLWLPDSQGLIYVQRADSSTLEIYQLPLDTQKPHLLVNLPECYPAFLHFLDQPSPDGRYLVYYYQNRSYILDTLSKQKPLLARVDPGSRLVWSPDGKLIALYPGNPAKTIDIQTGFPAETESETPWHTISAWAPNAFNFYFEIFLQP